MNNVKPTAPQTMCVCVCMVCVCVCVHVRVCVCVCVWLGKGMSAKFWLTFSLYGLYIYMYIVYDRIWKCVE